jgi:hypothetical protein
VPRRGCRGGSAGGRQYGHRLFADRRRCRAPLQSARAVFAGP